MSDEINLNKMTIYELVNFVDKQSVKIKLENGITGYFALFLKIASKDLGEKLKDWIDWYVGSVDSLNKAKIVEVDEKMLDFIKSDEYQKILAESEPQASLIDELNQINNETPFDVSGNRYNIPPSDVDKETDSEE